MITIKESPSADSRTAKGVVSKETLLKSSVQHIGDVQKAMAWFAGKLVEAGAIHDHTKVSGIDDFHDDFSRGLQGNAFKAGKWFQSHLGERHHLNDRCPDDVTLIDVMERVADITMAGMGRSGRVYDDTLDSEILLRAYRNTIQMLMRQVVVEKESEDAHADTPARRAAEEIAELVNSCSVDACDVCGSDRPTPCPFGKPHPGKEVKAEVFAAIIERCMAPAPLTSVIQWVRYDGTEETLPERRKLMLVKFPDVEISQMAYFGEDGIYTWKIFAQSDVKFQQECCFQKGFVWAYLPTPPAE